MPRRGTAVTALDGGLLFLTHIPAGLSLPSLPGALCAAKGQDPDVWHPDIGNRAGAEAAKAICQRCPARQPCLEWALSANEQHGVWGGTTPLERAAIRRARKPTALLKGQAA